MSLRYLGRVNFAPTAGTAHFAATAQATVIAPRSRAGESEGEPRLLSFPFPLCLSLSRAKRGYVPYSTLLREPAAPCTSALLEWSRGDQRSSNHPLVLHGSLSTVGPKY